MIVAHEAAAGSQEYSIVCYFTGCFNRIEFATVRDRGAE